MQKKNYFALFVLLLFPFIVKSQTPDWAWAKSIIGPDWEYGNKVSTDLAGNIIVSGFFLNDSIIIDSTVYHNAGGKDIFIIKYDPMGNVLWSDSAGSWADDEILSSCVDSAGNIYLTGYFEGSNISFSGHILNNTNSLTSNIFVVKYDPSGNVLWAKATGGVGDDRGTDMAVDNNGDVLVTGFYSSSINFDSITLSNAGSKDIFMAKFDTSGNVEWARSFGGSNEDEGVSITRDAVGSIYLSGIFTSPTISFGTTVLTLTMSPGYDIFLARCDTSGNIIWVRPAGGNGYDYSQKIACDATGNIYITGYWMGNTLSFSTTVLTNPQAPKLEIFIAKYDSIGTLQWAKALAGTGNDVVFSLAIDSAGNAIIGGMYGVDLHLSSITLNSAGSNDMFIAEYDPNGNVVWAKSAGGPDPDGIRGISIDVYGDILVTGIYRSPVLILGQTQLSNPTTTNSDYFIAKLGTLTGISHVGNLGDNLSVFPVPASGQFTVSIKNRTIDKLVIFNVTGQIVYTSTPMASESDLMLDSPGVYLLQVNSDNRNYFKRIIVN